MFINRLDELLPAWVAHIGWQPRAPAGAGMLLAAVPLVMLLALAQVKAQTGGLTSQAQLGFGTTTEYDQDTPLEITSDRLSIGQDEESAVFEGNVVVDRGNLRLTAERVEVRYREQSNEITKITAMGGVNLRDGEDVARADSAIYDLDDDTLTMHGQVLLSQPRRSLRAPQMVVDLTQNTATLTGRVTSVFEPEPEPD